MENRRPVLTSIVMDDIASGHFDRELGKLARSPQYAEYTAMELKTILTDKVVDNLLAEPRCGLRWILRGLAVVLVALLAVALMACGSPAPPARDNSIKVIKVEGICLRAQRLKTPRSVGPDILIIRGD